MSTETDIRPATLEDAAQIAVLIHELGYVISPELLRSKLVAMTASDADHALVAAAGDRLLGCISLHAMPLFHAEGNLGRITALVVHADQRGQGVGRSLILAAHAWFEARHCARLEVTSGDHREGAHRFYTRHGYAREGQRLLRKP